MEYWYVFDIYHTYMHSNKTIYLKLLAMCSDMFIQFSILGECIALWGEPNELSMQHHVYIFMQYVDS